VTDAPFKGGGGGGERLEPLSRAQASRRARRRRRRTRGLVRLITLVLIVAIVVWTGARVAHATSDRALVNDRVYTVRAGDTLWTIAARAYGAHRDLRPVVYAIESHNRLDTAQITPGEQLRLPPLKQ
jgi:nucleoid-associated protein YgaU